MVLARYGPSIELISLSSSGARGEMSFTSICHLSSDMLCKTLSTAGLDAEAILAKQTAEGVHLLARPRNANTNSPQNGSRMPQEHSQVYQAVVM